MKPSVEGELCIMGNAFEFSSRMSQKACKSNALNQLLSVVNFFLL